LKALVKACGLHEAGGVNKRIVASLIVLLVFGAGAVLYARRPKVEGQPSEAPAGDKAAQAQKGAPAGAQDRPTPILAATVEKRNVPIYLEGLGTVAAFNTVTLKALVDGRIQSVLFKEGQEVKKDQLLVEIDSRPFQILLHQAEAQLAKDQATLKNAQINLERYRALRAQKLVAQQQVDDQQAVVDQAAAALAADRAQIENANLQLTYARVTSPIDGRTGVRLIDPGNLVHAGDANGIVIITQLDPIAVLFTLPEDELIRVQKAMSQGPLKVEAIARDGKTSLGTGEVALIDNQINQQTGTIRLKAIFKNPERALWPNEFVKARLLVSTLKDGLVVPATVVQRGPNGTFAYVVEDEKAVLRPIELGTMAGDLAIIKSGLSDGEVVVAEGQYRLTPGGKVAIKTQAERAAGQKTDTATAASPNGDGEKSKMRVRTRGDKKQGGASE
jgi:multidrug efflux system membrane fusion protein